MGSLARVLVTAGVLSWRALAPEPSDAVAAEVAAVGSATVLGAQFRQAAVHGYKIAVRNFHKLQSQGRQGMGNLQPRGIPQALVYALRNLRVALKLKPVGVNPPPRPFLREIAQVDAQLRSDPDKVLQTAMALIDRLISKGVGDWLDRVELGVTTPAHPATGVHATAMKPQGSILESVVDVGSGGIKMPLLGFGTGIFHVRHHVLEKAIQHAASTLGYRHFDCAQNYGNEEVVGRALQASGVPRADLFVATKLSQKQDYGAEATPRLVRAQLARLGVSYLDLYMLHGDIGDAALERAAWQALEQLHDEGLVRALGLSNYDAAGIERVLSFARVRPGVLQIKYDVYHPGYQWARNEGADLVSWAQGQGIVVVGYSTLSGWPHMLSAVQDDHVLALASKYGRTASQLLLRHSLQKGLAVIPSSANEGRLRENTLVFDFHIVPVDMAVLDGLAHLASMAEGSVPSWIPDVFVAREEGHNSVQTQAGAEL